MALVPVQGGEEGLVPYDGGHELSETLREDGRLLRMFVSRGEDRKPGGRERATRDWLIRGEFYDQWAEEFAKRYGPRSGSGSDEDEDLEGSSALAILLRECQEALRRGKEPVDRLEQTIQEAGGDVYKLRDTLLAACKDLSMPRRHLGLGTGLPLTPEAIEAMKMRRQVRLREVVSACLQGIWKSGIGGEVLRVALEHVHKMIHRFEATEEDVLLARQGHSWNKLKELVGEIEGALPEGMAIKRPGVPEGRGTKMLIEMALKDLGGAATTRQLHEWVSAHPEAVQECGSKVRINRKERSVKGREFEVWQSTMSGALTHHFVKTKDPGGGSYLWRCKGDEGAAVKAAAPPLEDRAEPEAPTPGRGPEPEAPTPGRGPGGRAPTKRRRIKPAAPPDATAPPGDPPTAAEGAGGPESG